MSEITVFSRNACQPCRITKRYLNQAGIPFTEVLLEKAPEHIQQAVRQLPGVSAAPVVVQGDLTAPESYWSGFNLNRLDELAALHQSTA